MKLKLQSIIAVFIALVIYIPVAHGQAILTFSGGSGTPLSATLQRTVSYTITSKCGNSGPVFVFQAVGNPLLGSRRATGNTTFSVNGGTVQPIYTIGSGINFGGATTSNDLFILGSRADLNIGDKVVLYVGTTTSTTNALGAPPADGSFTTFIDSGFGERCSSNGVAADKSRRIRIF